MRRALITGAGGFIGRHLTSGLRRRGVQVHALIRQSSSRALPKEWQDVVVVERWDETSADLARIVAQVKPDVVFHVASRFIAEHKPEQVDELINSNVLFGVQLLEAMACAGVTDLVNFGSSWQHYMNRPYSPVCLYAATKQAFEALLQFYVEARGVRAVTLKLFDTFGPDDDRGKLFATLLRIARTGETLDLSAGEQMVDFVFIDDVVDAAVQAAERLESHPDPMNETYAVSSGHPLSLRDFVAEVAATIGDDVRVNWGARPYRAREVMTLWKDFATLPEWAPRHSLQDGIRKTLDV